MKRIIAAAFVAALGSVGLVGCGGTGSPGGPGATTKDPHNTTTTVATPRDNHSATTPDTHTSTPQVGNADDTFKLSVPSNLPPNHVKQGETKQYTIGISRGKNFDQDVAISFGQLPKGVTIEPAAPAIKHGDKEVKIGIKAANDAAVGEFTIKVIGHPTKGADATNEFTIHVDKK